MMYGPSMMRQALRPGLLVTLVVLALSACGGGEQQSEQACQGPAQRSASIDPDNLWDDATKSTMARLKSGQTR